MRYAKLFDGNLSETQTIFLENGGVIYNPTDEQFVENGYKIFIDSEIPVTEVNEYLVAEYTETETEITVSYTATKIPIREFDFLNT